MKTFSTIGFLLIISVLPAFSQKAPSLDEHTTGQYNGHRYSIARLTDGSSVTWRQAQEMAQEEGGHLVCIDDQDEFKFIQELAELESSFRYLWIGGYRSETKWNWVDGSRFDMTIVSSSNTSHLRAAMRGRNLRGLTATQIGLSFVIEYPEDRVEITLPSVESDTPPPSSTSDGSDDDDKKDDKRNYITHKSEPGTGKTTGNSHAQDIPLKRSQTSVNGLLVLSLSGGKKAGSASPMTLSALRADPSKAATIEFNQDVGEMMSKALKEVVTFIELRHDAWPKGRAMEISFEDKYNPKDGPSAAVACALLVESAITGADLDKHFAVTGDLNADGSVQPVGGIDAKVRGAHKRNCNYVAIPHNNSSSVYDTVVMQGFGPIIDIQIFSIAKFEQAYDLAQQEKTVALSGSMANFNKIAGVYRKNPSGFNKTLRHPKVIEMLDKIITATPNHLSAKILLDHARGNAQKSLSLNGSADFISTHASSIVDVIDYGKIKKIEGSLSANKVATAISTLRHSKSRLDKRTSNWIEELINYGTLLNTMQTHPPRTTATRNKRVDEINAAGHKVKEERELLFKDPEIIEELIQ